MVAKKEPDQPLAETGVYVDSSALAKLYVPEAESDALEDLLIGRRDLIISDLAITEVVSAIARRRREKALSVRQAGQITEALLSDAASGAFLLVDLSPAIHRHAEQILLATESVPLRTLDALHVALALSAQAGGIVTFDDRLAEAASLFRLRVVELR